MSQTPSSMSFAQKFGLKYYAYLFNVALYIATFEFTNSMQMTALVILLLPRIGKFLPDDDQLKPKNAAQYNKQYYHMLAPATYVFVVFGTLYYTWINYQRFNHSIQSLLSCSLAITFTIAQSIDGSHQLIHRNQTVLRVIGFIGLIPFQFTTYPVQHIYMHHKLVGTPQDAVTAPKNISVYRYFIKTIASSYTETFKYSKIFFAFCLILNWSYLFFLYQFALIQYNDSQLAIKKMLFFLGIAFTSLLVMETVEYIEHYGLVYRKNKDEKPILEISSWNTVKNPYYNWTTFRFQRHSDHHMNAYKIYSSMEINEKMPQFPFTFIEASISCMIPAIWYKAVDKLVDKTLKGQKHSEEDIKQTMFWINLANVIFFGELVLNVATAYYF